MSIGRFIFRKIFRTGQQVTRTPVVKIQKQKTDHFINSDNNFLKVKVLTVIDGDTILVKESDKKICIRLSAIDCPEDGQPWGNNAKFALIKLIGGREVYLETYGVDKYKRTLATVYVKNDVELMNVNERMVTLGHAWVMRRFWNHLPKGRQIRLNDVENWAKSKKVGLWKTKNPIPPWLWRKQDDESA